MSAGFFIGIGLAVLIVSAVAAIVGYVMGTKHGKENVICPTCPTCPSPKECPVCDTYPNTDRQLCYFDGLQIKNHTFRTLVEVYRDDDTTVRRVFEPKTDAIFDKAAGTIKYSMNELDPVTGAKIRDQDITLAYNEDNRYVHGVHWLAPGQPYDPDQLGQLFTKDGRCVLKLV